jgi:hypothetical protein
VANRCGDFGGVTWAMTTYFGPRFKPLFLAAFGAPVDPRRQWFYRLPYDLAS